MMNCALKFVFRLLCAVQICANTVFYKVNIVTLCSVSRLEGFVSNKEQSYEDPIEE